MIRTMLRYSVPRGTDSSKRNQTLTFVRLRAAPVLFVGATARAVVVGADRFLPALATRLLPAPRWPAILNDAREGKTVTGAERFRLLTVLAGRRATRSSIIVIVASRTEALSSAGWRPVACLLSRNVVRVVVCTGVEWPST